MVEMQELIPYCAGDCEACRPQLIDYVKAAHRTWPDLDRPVLYNWQGVVRYATAVCEGVRKEDWEEVVREAPHVLVWWLSFVGQLSKLEEESGLDCAFYVGATVDQVLWAKYPGCCPGCFTSELASRHRSVLYTKGGEVKSKDELMDKNKQLTDEQLLKLVKRVRNRRCHCLARKREMEELGKLPKAFSKTHLLRYAQQVWKAPAPGGDATCPPRTLHEWVQMFERLFEPQVETLTADEIAFHFIEEVGEVSEALQEMYFDVAKNPKATDNARRGEMVLALCEELADVFSWLITVIFRARRSLLCFKNLADAWAATVLDRALHKGAVGQIAAEIEVCHLLYRRVKGKWDRGELVLTCSHCGREECAAREHWRLLKRNGLGVGIFDFALLRASSGIEAIDPGVRIIACPETRK